MDDSDDSSSSTQGGDGGSTPAQQQDDGAGGSTPAQQQDDAGANSTPAQQQDDSGANYTPAQQQDGGGGATPAQETDPATQAQALQAAGQDADANAGTGQPGDPAAVCTDEPYCAPQDIKQSIVAQNVAADDDPGQLPGGSPARPGALEVTVVDAGGTAIAGASVNIQRPSQQSTASTDASGKALFDNLIPDDYTVVASTSCCFSDFTVSGIHVPGGSSPSAGGTPVRTTVKLSPCDFVVNAPCRIVKADGGTVQITATEEQGCGAGTYAWTTSSTNITLQNANTPTVTVQGANPSTARDAETITVTRTCPGGPGCTPVVKTVTVTVAKVTFSASANQRYGYDDFDTPSNSLDDHICIKQLDYTFLQVTIQGGALGTDFDFVCDDPSICTAVAPGATASFDLRLNAGDKTKNDTPLKAKVKCSSAESFTQIQVHVYKEKVVDVVVAKIYDSTVAGTSLKYPTADYAGHTATVNAKVKEAVVKYSITNYDSANGQTNVRYDLDGNGVLSWDIGKNGGAEFDTIKAAMTGTGTKTRVAIIRDMKSFYFLSAAAAVGDTTVRVTAGSVFAYPAGSYSLGAGASQESVTVASSSGSTITLGAPLTKAHAAGEGLEFPAGGWSSDPIVIVEGSDSLDTVKWTVPHEAGHRNLALADIDVDKSTIMYYNRTDWTDHRLRYCPRTKRYEAGTENQWETIPR
ncbi:MAG TPA: carboxypeptidase regulatory-like domain-containing protein [Bryobacteraceae bacterium]